MQNLQTEWRKIGFAPKKYNLSIYETYRAECDRFFHAKTEFFKDIRDAFITNLKHKRALVAKAQEITENAKAKLESNEMTRELWDEMTSQVQAIQAEWKTVGMVARKYSDELWKKFSETCDAFFEAKREAQKGERLKQKGERAARAARQTAAGDQDRREQHPLLYCQVQDGQ